MQNRSHIMSLELIFRPNPQTQTQLEGESPDPDVGLHLKIMRYIYSTVIEPNFVYGVAFCLAFPSRDDWGP